MELQRMAAGEYVIRSGDKSVQIMKGLDGDWDVTPGSGVDGESRRAPTYADAKLIAQWMLRNVVASHKATVALAKADNKIALAERLHKIADEIAH